MHVGNIFTLNLCPFLHHHRTPSAVPPSPHPLSVSVSLEKPSPSLSPSRLPCNTKALAPSVLSLTISSRVASVRIQSRLLRHFISPAVWKLRPAIASGLRAPQSTSFLYLHINVDLPFSASTFRLLDDTRCRCLRPTRPFHDASTRRPSSASASRPVVRASHRDHTLVRSCGRPLPSGKPDFQLPIV